MIDTLNGVPFCSREPSPLRVDASILTFETPNVEEIGRVIWQRQHDALASDAISHKLKWREESIPSKFWDEFLLDARAVLLLLYNKHLEYHKPRERLTE